MIMKALFSLPLSLLLPLVPLPALAEEGWEEVKDTLYEGKEVVLLPLQSEISSEFLEEQPPPQPELHFSGDQEGGVNLAQATLAFPPISVGEQGFISPFLALKGQDDGTHQGQSLAVEGGLQLSLGQLSLHLSLERTIHPFPFTTFMVNASFKF
jgi:hypothetical protein